jgi:hypothetical protein
MTNNQQRTDLGAHCHHPPLAPPDLQAKAAVMKADAEAVTVGDGNTGGGGSGGGKDNGSDSNGGCTDKNNQQSTKSVGSHGNKNDDGDSDEDNYDNDGDGGGGGSDGGRRWRWAL